MAGSNLDDHTSLEELLPGTWEGTLFQVDHDRGEILQIEVVTFTFGSDGRYDSNAGTLDPSVEFFEYYYGGEYRVLGDDAILAAWWDGDARSFQATHVPVDYDDGYLYLGTLDHFPTGASYRLEKVAAEDTEDG